MWIKLDDGLHAHPKAMLAGNAALGLWVRAASWCGFHLTDGRVPRGALAMFSATADDAEALVQAGLWEATETGWRFHDWLDYNPSREVVKADREKARQRMARLRGGKTQPAPTTTAPGITDLNTERDARRGEGTPGGYPPRTADEPAAHTSRTSADVRPNIGRSARGVRPEFADPDPIPSPPSEGGARERTPARPSAPASARCATHAGVQDPPPCRGCATAREALTAQQAEDLRRRRAANDEGWCSAHPDQRAAACSRCEAEAAPREVHDRGAAAARAAVRRPTLTSTRTPWLPPTGSSARSTHRLLEHEPMPVTAETSLR